MIQKHISQLLTLTIISLFGLSLFQTLPTYAATFTVVNTNSSGAGSLTDAINQAEASDGNDTIEFNIPGGGVQTINMNGTNLPTITESLIFAGNTQPGSTPEIPAINITNSTLGVVNSTVNFGLRNIQLSNVTTLFAPAQINITDSKMDRTVDIRSSIAGFISNNQIELQNSDTTLTALSCFDCQSIIVSDNNISGEEYGVLFGGVGGGSNEITDNIITNTTNAIAILTSNTSDNNLIEGNIITTAIIGVNINQGSDNLILNNTFNFTQFPITIVDSGSERNRITRNQIYNNDSTSAINLGVGANESIEPPVITEIINDGTNIIIRGRARTGSIIELYSQSPSLGGGSSLTYQVSLVEGVNSELNSDTDNTIFGMDGSGSELSNFEFTFPQPVGFGPGSDIVATATDILNNTSTFSTVVQVQDENPDQPYQISINQSVSYPDGQIPIAPGHRIQYTITAENTGTIDVSDAYLINTLPDNTTIVNTNPTISSGSYDSANNRWNIGSLPVGQSQTLQYTVTVNPATWGQVVVNVAELYENDPLFLSNDQPATVTSNTQIAIQNVPTLSFVQGAETTVFGNAVTFSAQVSDPSLLGYVEFYDGDTLLQRVNIDNNGLAQYTTSSLTVGNHSISARYFYSDTMLQSQTITHIVTPQASSNPTTTTVVNNPTPSVVTNPTQPNGPTTTLAATGDQAPVVLVSSIGLLSALGGIMLSRSNKHNKSRN